MNIRLGAYILVVLLSACQESLDERFEREAREITKLRCPQMIAVNARIDSLTYDKGTRTMHYFYTLSGNADNPTYIATVDAPKVLREELNNSPAMKDYKKHGCTFEYTYYSTARPGTILQHVKLTPSDYQ